MKTVWVVTGTSESSDHYGPDIFDHKLSDKELYDWCHNCDGHFGDTEGYQDGPGYGGSYVYPEMNEVEIKTEV